MWHLPHASSQHTFQLYLFLPVLSFCASSMVPAVFSSMIFVTNLFHFSPHSSLYILFHLIHTSKFPQLLSPFACFSVQFYYHVLPFPHFHPSLELLHLKPLLSLGFFSFNILLSVLSSVHLSLISSPSIHFLLVHCVYFPAYHLPFSFFTLLSFPPSLGSSRCYTVALGITDEGRPCAYICVYVCAGACVCERDPMWIHMSEYGCMCACMPE